MDLEDLLVESSLQLASLSRQASQLDHDLLVGQTREKLFKEILGNNLLPSRYGIGAGRVVGTDGSMSREADVVFYNALDCPKFLDFEATIFPSLGVHGIAEIKSTLEKRELNDGLEKIRQFKMLYQNEGQLQTFGSRFGVRTMLDPKPFGVIFAFTAGTQLTTLLANLNAAESDVAPDLKCDLIVVNGEGLIARSEDGLNPTAVWAHHGVYPAHTIVIPAMHKTLGIFYEMLSAMLVSVPTFPVNPAQYRRVVLDYDGHKFSGQIRTINAATKAKETLTEAFLKRIAKVVFADTATSFNALELRVFKEGVKYESFQDGKVWLFDPDGSFENLQFPPALIPGMGNVISLASGCLLITIDDRQVLVPRSYLTKSNVDIQSR